MSAALATALRQLAPVMSDLAREVKHLASVADAEYPSSIVFLPGFFDRESFEGMECVIGLRRATELNELVHVDFNIDDRGAAKVRNHVLALLARLEIGESLEGVGEIVIRETEKGFVVLRSNLGEVASCHVVSPIYSDKITPEMIEAGLRKLYEYDFTLPIQEEIRLVVGEVFLAMQRVRP